MRKELHKYVADLFAQEDDVLRAIQEDADQNGLPSISLRAHEGRMMQVLLKLIKAQKVVEIGTLAGYSGTWIARALPADGKLYTLEFNPKHAEVARRSFERANISDKVEIIEGVALENLPALSAQGPFDFIFLDANKADYPKYLAWAVENLREGGIVAAHNAFRGGKILEPVSDDDHGMIAFNEALAAHPQLDATIFAVGDGMAIGVKTA